MASSRSRLWRLSNFAAYLSVVSAAVGDLTPRAQLDPRFFCLEDSWLQSFQLFPDEAIPFCSSFIGIPLNTAAPTAHPTM